MTKETFEDALKELESVAAKLNDDSVPLEEALKLYERGKKLAKRCRAQLESVEKRVEQIEAEAAAGDEPRTKPFSPEEG